MNKIVPSNKSISMMLILAGIVILYFDFFYYPLFLPKIINSENSQWIQLSGYIFYFVFIISIVVVILGIRQMFKSFVTKFSNCDNYMDKDNFHHSTSLLCANTDFSSQDNNKHNSTSILKILFDMVNDKKSIIFFLPATITYGFFYAIISGTLIIHFTGDISRMYGIDVFPSIIMMQYGPVGYVPTISIYLSNSLGILIIPINIVMIIIVSTLVGLNAVSSIHTLRVYNLEKKRKDLSSIISYRGNGTKFLSILGVTSSLFTVCPTCASFYLFSVLAGPFATTVSSFTVNYYMLILLVSIPLLITSPFVNALNIRKIKSIGTQCNIKYKNEKM